MNDRKHSLFRRNGLRLGHRSEGGAVYGTYVVDFLGVEPCDQESVDRTHLLERSSVVAVVKSALDVHLVGWGKVPGAHHLHHQLGCMQESGQENDIRAAGVVHVSRRSQQVSALDSTVVVRMLRHHYPEGSRTLGMSHVLQSLLSSSREDEIDHVRNIDAADLVPREVPELLGRVVPGSVTVGVAITAAIAQPDIESGIGQHVDQAGLRSHQDVVS